MLDKINVTKVVCDHFKTFRNYSTNKLRPYDLILFFIIPIVAAILLLSFGGVLPQNLVGVIVTSLSVFTGLLLNLLMVSFNASQNFGHSPHEDGKRRQDTRNMLLREVISNVSFAVLIAIITTVLVLCFGIIGNKVASCIIKTFSLFIYFLGALFFLTLFMLLKRVYSLLSNDQIV